MASDLLTLPPKPAKCTRRLTVRLAPATWQKLRKASVEADVAPAELIRHVVEVVLAGEA